MSDSEKQEPDTKPEGQDQAQEGIQFLQLAAIFFNQGAMALGAMPNPMTGELFVSFESAQDSIGILELLREKTKGNLDAEEERTLASMVDELKLAFVQAIRDPQMRELAEKSMQQHGAPAEQSEPSRIITPDGRPAASADTGPKIILPGSGG